MTEETPNSEVQEVATPVEAEVKESETVKAKKEADERNFKAMRLKNAELEKELKLRQEMLDKVLQAQMANSVSQKKEVDEFDQIGAEEYIPKGKVEKLIENRAQKYAEAIAKQEVEKHLQRQQDSQYMDRLTRQYSDFSEVVNPETLSLLEEKEPELAKMITDLKDPYKIGTQAYKYIKAMNLFEKAPEVRRAKEVEKALEKSEKAILSPASMDKRPMAQAFKLTEAMKKDLYREMHGYAQLASGVPEMS